MSNKIQGLTSKEAKDRYELYGPNEILEINKVSAFKILFRQVRKNVVVYLLLISMILSFIVGKSLTAYVVFFTILIVIMTAFIQEYKAEKSVEKLKDMITHVSVVIRDGVEKEILTKDVVPGDMLILRTGEKISADCVVISEKNLLVNESALTGESDEIRKKSTTNLNTSDEENLIYSGSFIVEGKCIAMVTKTGMSSKIGKIASLISTAEKDLPLQRKVNKITKWMAIGGLSISIIIGMLTLFQMGTISETIMIDILILVIAMSVSSFPEALPVVFVTTLSVGVYKMAKKNAIVNRMSIIETLGETTVICADKTGTITKGEMTVKRIFTDHNSITVSGVGYNNQGEFLLDDTKIDPKKYKTLNLLLKNATLCNDARIERIGNKESEYNIFGAPTEASLLIMSAKGNIYKEDFEKRLDEIPFSSEKKIMHILSKDENRKIVYSKGALDYILRKCKYIQRENGVFRLLERDRESILNTKHEMTSNSLRTIAFAYKESSTLDINQEISSDDLIFLGFVGIEDAPREGIKEALRDCKKAGIKIKMITGDDKETAIAIAKQINLNKGKIIEGFQLDELTDKDLIKIVKSTVIFARVNPEHKLRIVKALKENGEIVTMTGDGVNDAPALKEAHIGVAMGKNGTDVSRSVADLILKDDNFVTIVDAIREGRTIFNNIRKFVTYLLSCNVAEFIVLFLGVLLAPTLGWPIPILLAIQILFMNMVTDNLPAITLGLNKSSKDIMLEKPRKNASILNKDLIKLIAGSAVVAGIFVVLSFYVTFTVLGQDIKDARTTALLALIVIEIAGAFCFRSFRKTALNRSPFINPYLAIASGVSILATILIIYTPINIIFETIPLPITDWLVCTLLSVLFVFLFDTFKRINNKRQILNLEQ